MATTTTKRARPAVATPITNADERLDAIVADATDDKVALERIAAYIAEMTEALTRARQLRDYTALRLREFGVPGRHIAEIAGVTDSYLARRALELGAERKVRRDADGNG